MKTKLLKWLGVGSELHWQTYRMVREYPLATRFTMMVFFNFGFAVAAVIGLVLGKWQ